MATEIFDTDNGAVFNLTLDPGYCFAMCIDLARVIRTHVRQGNPAKLPYRDELTPGRWAIVQSAYEINDQSNDRRLIEAQGLSVVASIPESPLNADFATLAQTITQQPGTTIFGISGDAGAHALLWHRDDANSLFLFLDPNDGLYQCSDANDGRILVETTTSTEYADLDNSYDSVTVDLA